MSKLTRGADVPQRSSRPWWIAGSACIAVLLLVLAFAYAGRLLVIEDPLQHARAVVVFGGKVPFRPMEAARLYAQGWSDEVWLTQGAREPEDVALAGLGIEQTPEWEYSRMVLRRLGVPDSAIRVLPDRNANTAQEVRTISRELARFPGDRIILVTSSYHTRRVKFLWRKLAGDEHESIVRYTPDEPFVPGRWWRDSADGMAVMREWFGLLNAWLGFPVKSEHW